MSVPGPRTRYDWRAFTVVGIPVTFSAWFLLVVWAVLARSSSFGTGMIHLVAVAASVLAHELGHALPARRYRLSPAILIHGFGGWCEHAPARRPNEDLAVAAGGPAAGLLVGAVAWGLGRVLPGLPAAADVLLWDLAWMGIFWTAVNLLPLLPLDGGTITVNLLERWEAIDRPTRTTRVIGIVTGIGAGIAALVYGEIAALLLIALLVWDNAAQLGWAPRNPLYATGAAPPRGRAERFAWRPTPVVGSLLAPLVLAAACRTFVDLASFPPLALDPATVWAQPWRLLTFPLLPAGRPVALLSAIALLWLVGPLVERRLGPRGAVLLAGVATVVAGLAAVGGATFHPGTLAGPVPLALAFAASWAFFQRNTPLGPNALGAIRPPLALAMLLVVDLGDRWSAGDAVGAASDLAAVAVGHAAAAAPWKPVVLWWKLRNPPPVDFH